MKKKTQKPRQDEMFPEGEDLPLFSGTPQQGTVDPFKAKSQPKQFSLFNRNEYLERKA